MIVYSESIYGVIGMELKFDVTGMTCAACSARVEKVTAKVPGVTKEIGRASCRERV